MKQSCSDKSTIKKPANAATSAGWDQSTQLTRKCINQKTIQIYEKICFIGQQPMEGCAH